MKKKIEETSIKRLPVYIVPNPKGGVGKTTVAQQILPAILRLNPKNKNKKIVIFEFDDNNEKRFNYSAESNILNTTFKIGSADGILEGLSLEILTAEDLIVIIDCGGSNDTHMVLQALAKSDFFPCHYCIPTLAGDDPKSLLSLVEKIKSNDLDSELIFFLNKCRDLNGNTVVQDFWQIFGDNNIEELVNNEQALMMDRTIYVPEINIFSKLAMFKKSIYDIIEETKANESQDIRELKLSWAIMDKEEMEQRATLDKEELLKLPLMTEGRRLNAFHKFGKECKTGFNTFLEYNKIKEGI